MKRIFCNVLMFASVIAMLLSCESNVAKKTLLKMEVDNIQKELPIKLGSMGDLSAVTYEDDVVTLTYLVNVLSRIAVRKTSRNSIVEFGIHVV